MSETEAYDRVLSCVMNHPLNREALIEILRYCEQERDQADVEAHMQAPSAAYSALLSPYRLICQLVDAGGIVCTEVDADGEPELDDLVQGWRYETTDAGNEVAGYFDPARRVERLAAAHPEAVAAFRTVLLFCDRPRKRAELAAFIEKEKLLSTLRVVLPAGSTLRPSVFMDKLESAGMLAWNDGWSITEAGRRYLQQE